MNCIKREGVDRVLPTIGDDLNRTLCLVILKSGGTKEARNGMRIAKAAYEQAGLDFGSHAIATTMRGSDLDKLAIQNRWLARFPVWDWVRGRTIELSAVGLPPDALQWLNITDFLSVTCDIYKQTKAANAKYDPAMQLTLACFNSGNDIVNNNMVILPNKDRPELFYKYLQQLVMESLGKELDFNQNIVNQGITVLGNKGAIDQHSYIQQLRDGLNDFFVPFIEMLADGHNSAMMVEDKVTAGDFLNGFFLATLKALAEKDRESLIITVTDVPARTVGMLIAPFDRAVGFYASLVNINAHHQPGVEADKRAAGQAIEIQRKILTYIFTKPRELFTAPEISQVIVINDDIYIISRVIQHLAANACHGISKTPSQALLESKYDLN